MDRRSFSGRGFLCRADGATRRRRAPAGAPSCRIREVRAIRLRNGFNSRFVRVYTEEGLTGTGECVDFDRHRIHHQQQFQRDAEGPRSAGHPGHPGGLLGLSQNRSGRRAVGDVRAWPGRALSDRRQRRGDGAVGPGGQGVRPSHPSPDGRQDARPRAGLSACRQSRHRAQGPGRDQDQGGQGRAGLFRRQLVDQKRL